MSRTICIVLTAILATGCSEGTLSPTGPSQVLGSPVAVVETASGSAMADILAAKADSYVFGGLNLDGYCGSLGYDGAVMTKPRIGKNAAINNWQCFPAGKYLINMNRACQWQYGDRSVMAEAKNRDDAYSYVCKLR